MAAQSFPYAWYPIQVHMFYQKNAVGYYAVVVAACGFLAHVKSCD